MSSVETARPATPKKPAKKPAPRPKPYDSSHSKAFDAAAVKDCTGPNAKSSVAWTKTQVAYVGLCPRCRHDIGLLEDIQGTSTWFRLARAKGPIILVCNCTQKHPGAPDPGTSCGARFVAPHS